METLLLTLVSFLNYYETVKVIVINVTRHIISLPRWNTVHTDSQAKAQCFCLGLSSEGLLFWPGPLEGLCEGLQQHCSTTYGLFLKSWMMLSICNSTVITTWTFSLGLMHANKTKEECKLQITEKTVATFSLDRHTLRVTRELRLNILHNLLQKYMNMGQVYYVN